MSEIKSKIGLTPKGAYSSSTTYDYLDYVTNADGTYTSKQANNVGHALTETDWWEHDFISPKMRVNATTKNWEVSYDGGTTYTDTGVSSKGTDAVSPQLKIDSTTFNWMLSTDGGATWTDLGVASKQVTSSASVVQETGTSITDVMSQKAITDVLATKADHGYPSNPKSLKQVDDLKENSVNKQNSLTVDGTGTKFPTVDAVNAGLQPKLVSGTNIKTINGQSLLGSGDVSNLITSYTHSGNKEVNITAYDSVTGTFTAVGHGLSNGDIGWMIPHRNKAANPRDFMLCFPRESWGHYVVNKTDDTFQLSATNGGEATVYAVPANLDFTAFHFEIVKIAPIVFTNLANEKAIRIVFYQLNSRYAPVIPNMIPEMNGILLTDVVSNYGNNYVNSGSGWDETNCIYSSYEMKVYIGDVIQTFSTLIETKSTNLTTIASTVRSFSAMAYNSSINSITSIKVKPGWITNGTNIKLYRI